MTVQAYLVMTNVSPEDWSARIDTTPRIIGRSRGADIRIPGQFRRVSRRHAEIWSDEEGHVWVREAGSSAGTKINGVWIEPGRAVRLVPGDRLWLGEVELALAPGLSPVAQVVAEANIQFRYSDEESGSRLRNAPHPDRLRLRQLTPAELEVVLWVCRGYVSDKELGRMLDRSPNTVRTQMGSIFQKLGVRSRAELVSWLKRASVVRANDRREDPAD
jgi:DNA-binding CsgD family transcriptional regulator